VALLGHERAAAVTRVDDPSPIRMLIASRADPRLTS
jgi:hypothetical protein